MKTNNLELITGFARAAITIEMNALMQHCELVERMLRSEQVNLQAEFQKLAARPFDSDDSDYDDHLSDEHWMMHTVLPRLQWQSQLLTVYASVEHVLNEFCEVVRQKKGSKLSFKDLGGNGITRARNYLVKVGGIEQPFQTHKWQRIKLLSDVRNIVAHRRGEIDIAASKELVARLQVEENLEVRILHEESQEAEIVFDHKFIKQAIKDSSSFLSSIARFRLS